MGLVVPSYEHTTHLCSRLVMACLIGIYLLSTIACGALLIVECFNVCCMKLMKLMLLNARDGNPQ